MNKKGVPVQSGPQGLSLKFAMHIPNKANLLPFQCNHIPSQNKKVWMLFDFELEQERDFFKNFRLDHWKVEFWAFPTCY